MLFLSLFNLDFLLFRPENILQVVLPMLLLLLSNLTFLEMRSVLTAAAVRDNLFCGFLFVFE